MPARAAAAAVDENGVNILIATIVWTCLLVGPQGDGVELSSADVVARIKAALKEGPAPAIETIEKFGTVADISVTKSVAAGLRHGDPEVKFAAIQALRWNSDKSAFTELMKVRKQKPIVGDVRLGPEFFYALGQHANPKALPFLAARLHVTRKRDKSRKARILAIGRIRTKASIEILVKLLKSSRRRSSNDVRLALAVLTGQDDGKRSFDWGTWWKNNKRGFKISATEPELSKRVGKSWNKVWRPPNSRGKKRPKPSQDGMGDDGSKKKV